MPSVNYDVVLYPTTSQSATKKFKDINDVSVEFRAALTRHFVQEEKACEPDDIRDVVFDSVKVKALWLDAKAYISKAEKAKVTPNLLVRGGIDKTGNLVISVTDAHPALFDQAAIVRKEFVQKVVKLFRKTKNVVANIEPNQADPTISKASERQAAKFGTTVQKGADAVDVGGIKFGTIVLAAHGGSAEVSGTILGEHLGQKTPDQIVKLLTKNADANKNLNKKFKGTIVLSGCFTAAGNAIIPPGYNYNIFAQEVKSLLDKAGYSNFLVKGMAGPSITTDSGDKLVRPAKKAAEQDKVKEKLDVKNAVTKEEKEAAEERLQKLATHLGSLERTFQSISESYEGAKELAELDPTSLEFKQMAASLEKQVSDMRPKMLALMKERSELRATIRTMDDKLDKRAEKLKKLFDDMDAVRTADGVLTFGQRSL